MEINLEHSDNKKFNKSGFLSFGNIKDILIIAFITVVTWKLVNSNISINIETFTFTDLLSVLLAFFAIALSAAFYFKATDSSTLFYDNTYKFTKDVSEILGRIEAGFGEKLKHIDEGQNGLRDKFDKMPFDIQEAKEEEKQEEENIKLQEKERNKIILDLMEKARVAGEDKDELLAELEKHSKELDHSRMELRRLQREINIVESDVTDISKGFIEYFSGKIGSKIPHKYVEAPMTVLRKRFQGFVDDNIFDTHDLRYMTKHGILDDDGKLTSKGGKVMKEAIRFAI